MAAAEVYLAQQQYSLVDGNQRRRQKLPTNKIVLINLLAMSQAVLLASACHRWLVIVFITSGGKPCCVMM